jgi:nitroreductase
MQPIKLHGPVFEGRVTLFESLKMRKTSREVSGKEIPLQVLSDILWAAQGINRINGPFEGPGRTAGSASNSQEILLYVVREEGTYLYEPDRHLLTPVAEGDLRALAIGAGQREAGADAPVRCVYAVDIEKFKTAGFQEPGLHDPEVQKSYYFVDTGLIAQNVYLASASLGLASWFHNCNKSALEKKLGLGPHRRALFGHTIGYPA